MSFNTSIHKSTSRQFEKFFSLLCSALTTRVTLTYMCRPANTNTAI